MAVLVVVALLVGSGVLWFALVTAERGEEAAVCRSASRWHFEEAEKAETQEEVDWHYSKGKAAQEANQDYGDCRGWKDSREWHSWR